MIRATEAKAMVKKYNEEKVTAVKARAKKWLEQNVDGKIYVLAAKGETTVSYNLNTKEFDDELLQMVCELLKEAGYEVDYTPIQGATHLTIDW